MIKLTQEPMFKTVEYLGTEIMVPVWCKYVAIDLDIEQHGSQILMMFESKPRSEDFNTDDSIDYNGVSGMYESCTVLVKTDEQLTAKSTLRKVTRIVK